jgi:hypothetical protein
VIDARVEAYDKGLAAEGLTMQECAQVLIGKSPTLLNREPPTVIENVRMVLAMRADGLVRFKPNKKLGLVAKLLGRPPYVTHSKEHYLLCALCADSYANPNLLGKSGDEIRQMLRETDASSYKAVLECTGKGQKLNNLATVLGTDENLAAAAQRMPSVLAQYERMAKIALGEDPGKPAVISRKTPEVPAKHQGVAATPAPAMAMAHSADNGSSRPSAPQGIIRRAATTAEILSAHKQVSFKGRASIKDVLPVFLLP